MSHNNINLDGGFKKNCVSDLGKLEGDIIYGVDLICQIGNQ